MRIFEFTKPELSQNDFRGKVLLLESQNFGQDYELKFRVAVSDVFGDFLTGESIGREVEDTGRTAGFYQNFGGQGIYKPDEIDELQFSDRLGKQLKMSPQGKVSFEGATWNDILNKMPLTDSGKAMLNLSKPVSKKPSKKSSPKTKRTKKSVTTK
jgi:hypothetical protein